MKYLYEKVPVEDLQAYLDKMAKWGWTLHTIIRPVAGYFDVVMGKTIK